MAFIDLYDAVQNIDGKISTLTLTELAKEHSSINRVKEMWSGLVDDLALRGFYIEGPLGPPVPLEDNEALIVLSREMCRGPTGKHWRHFVYTKELMHVFDTDEEKANTEETFDIQVQRFGDPTREISPQFRAEGKAFWRALMVLCQAEKRQEFKALLASGSMTIEVMAAALRIPAAYAHYLLQDNFEDIAAHLMND